MSQELDPVLQPLQPILEPLQDLARSVRAFTRDYYGAPAYRKVLEAARTLINGRWKDWDESEEARIERIIGISRILVPIAEAIKVWDDFIQRRHPTWEPQPFHPSQDKGWEGDQATIYPLQDAFKEATTQLKKLLDGYLKLRGEE